MERRHASIRMARLLTAERPVSQCLRRQPTTCSSLAIPTCGGWLNLLCRNFIEQDDGNARCS